MVVGSLSGDVVVTVVGAIVVALITAVTTDRRLNRQLIAECNDLMTNSHMSVLKPTELSCERRSTKQPALL